MPRIIHPELGPDHIAEVPASSLAQHYAAGWRDLADDETPPEPGQAGPPAPMTRAQAARTASKAKAPSGSEVSE